MNKTLLWVIAKYYGLITLYACYLTILLTLIFSIFNNYKVTIATNTINECIPEIIFLSIGGILYLITLKPGGK